MLERLNFIENKYEELSIKISDPTIIADQKKWQKLCREHAELEEIVIKYREYKEALQDLEDNKEMLKEETDKDMREMEQEEIKRLGEVIEKTESELKILQESTFRW